VNWALGNPTGFLFESNEMAFQVSEQIIVGTGFYILFYCPSSNEEIIHLIIKLSAFISK
jgi:hypothetical protein